MAEPAGTGTVRTSSAAPAAAGRLERSARSSLPKARADSRGGAAAPPAAIPRRATVPTPGEVASSSAIQIVTELSPRGAKLPNGRGVRVPADAAAATGHFPEHVILRNARAG